MFAILRVIVAAVASVVVHDGVLFAFVIASGCFLRLLIAILAILIAFGAFIFAIFALAVAIVAPPVASLPFILAVAALPIATLPFILAILALPVAILPFLFATVPMPLPVLAWRFASLGLPAPFPTPAFASLHASLTFLPMKPGDHPEFFHFPAPEGRSRESTIRLDADGRFFHDGAPVDHPRLAEAMHGWIARHPDDGRYILSNGYDWTYFTVEDAPFAVRAVRVSGSRALLALDDGTEEAWDPTTTRIAPSGALYARVKTAAAGGPYEARFTRHAQNSLAPLLVLAEGKEETGAPAAPAIRLGGEVVPIGSTAKRAELG